jgi:hypothetical protein
MKITYLWFIKSLLIEMKDYDYHDKPNDLEKALKIIDDEINKKDKKNMEALK